VASNFRYASGGVSSQPLSAAGYMQLEKLICTMKKRLMAVEVWTVKRLEK